MSETTSPSISIHPVSPYSLDSLNSPADSAPRSDPTSDEEPDLGFNQVLRELPHLQPSHRIPIQIRSATSSTTPTYHAESVTGTDVRSRAAQRSRNSNSTRASRSGMSASTLSSFTRPPTSSMQPDGSTVWDHPRIASYLFGLSGTPSNEHSHSIEEEDEDEEEEEEDATGDRYSLSPASRSSTPRTVEIADEHDLPEDQSQVLQQFREVFSPETTTSAIPVTVAVASESQRLDSRETARTEDDEIEIDSLSNSQDRDSNSLTYMARPRPPLQEEQTVTTPSSQEYESSDPSMQLRSQQAPPTTTSSSTSSVSLSSYENGSDITIPIAGPSSVNSFITTSIETTTYNIDSSTSASDSASTLMDIVRNRSRNPLPSNTISDSYMTTTGTGSGTRSSHISLLSYQLPETPSAGVIYEDSEPERFSGFRTPRHANVSNLLSGSETPSTSTSMMTQQSQSIYSSGTGTGSGTVSGHRRMLSHAPNVNPPSASSPLMDSDLSSLFSSEEPLFGSILPNVPGAIDTWREIAVVNDLGTPDQPPSESILFEPPRRIFEPIRDDEDEPADADRQTSDTRYAGLVRQESVSVTSFSAADSGSTTSTSSAHTSTRTEVQSSGTATGVGTAHYAISDSHIEDEVDADSFRYPYSHTPRHLAGRTPRGIPGPSTVSVTGGTKPTNEQQQTSAPTSSSKGYSFLEQQFGFPSSSSYTALETESGSTRETTESQRKLDIQSGSTTTLSRSDTIVASSQSNAEASVAYQQTRQRPLQVPQSQSQVQSQALDYSDSAVTTQPPPPHEVSSRSSFPNSISHSERHVLSHPQGYSHASSVGLHLLPSDPLTVGGFEHPPNNSQASDSNRSSNNIPLEDDPHPIQLYPAPLVGTGPSNASDWEAEQLHAEAESSQTRLFPSLGYLDEALSFIATERAKWSAARDNVSSNATGSGSWAEGSRELEEEGENENENGMGQEEEGGGGGEWQHVFDADKGGEQPKRKRRRKRSSKHPTAAAVPIAQEVPVEILPPGYTAEGAATIGRGSHRRRSPGSSPRKRRSKSAAPSLTFSLSSHSVTSEKSGTMTPGRPLNKRRDKDFLVPPPAASTSTDQKLSVPIDSDFDDDGVRTPTNVGAATNVMTVPGIINVSKISVTGTKGKRVGRREREREKLKFDMMKGQSSRDVRKAIDSLGFSDEFDIGAEYEDGNGNVDEEDEEEADGLGENDSISNMSLLQPPRRKRSQRKPEGDTDHPVAVDIVYQDKDVMSVSPNGRVSFTGQTSTVHEVDGCGHGHGHPTGNADEGEDVFASKPNVAGEKEKEKKKRTRPKRIKTTSQSQPEVDTKVADDDDPGPSKLKESEGKGMRSDDFDRNMVVAPSSSKRGRLLSLAQNLQQLFPEQREELGRVIKYVMKEEAATNKRKVIGTADVHESGEPPGLVKSLPIPVPGKGKKSREGHTKAASESIIALEPDVEGGKGKHAATDGETEEPDEEEIDPRGRVPKKKDPLIHVFIDHSNILIGLLSHLKRATPFRKRIYIARRKPLSGDITPSSTISTAQAKVDVAAAQGGVKPSSSRPLPVLPSTTQPIDPPSYPIPLPSFATFPRSLPSASLSKLKDHLHSSEEIEHQKTANSDGYDGSGIEDADDHGSFPPRQGALPGQKEKKHLWHTSLTLILERGRPVTRRVVVASSPLYQPMESIERLGYELRVFIRVPDLDPERQRDRAGAGRSSTASKGSQASPAKISHVKRISGSTSAESGSGGNASGAGSSGLHPYYNSANSGSPQKVKYREQGVDELLQLKLHQAIAASDSVPDGSTIVLATGDGNIGQFNEEGFLGPIRTALRRGWRVELYAWEDGLSRAWRREFGDATEWGKSGMFRIIGMEQFAGWLVEWT